MHNVINDIKKALRRYVNTPERDTRKAIRMYLNPTPTHQQEARIWP